MASRWIRITRRLRFWLSRGRRAKWLADEMAFHLDSMVEDLVAQGVPERDARAMARRRFGDMTRLAEDARATWIARWWSDFVQDLRLAGRSMRRQAGYTAFVVVIVGLGVGASATVFSVVNAMLLRPLPFRDPARLVWIANEGSKGEEWMTQVGHVVDLRSAATSFVDIGGWNRFYHPGDSELTGVGEPERVTSVPVTQNFFGLLGIEPAVGRFFTEAEANRPLSAPPAVVLSHGYWVQRFAADTTLVGRTLTLNNQPVLVVGVLPASFDFSSIFSPGIPVDVFVPWPLTEETSRQGNSTQLVARLRPGVTPAQALAELKVLAPTLERRHPDRNWFHPILVPLSTRVSQSFSAALMVLAGAVALVMLIVCANLSNLQLARLGARQKEMAVRVALGAGRLRLLRQLLTESVVLACGGAVLGIGLALGGTRGLSRLTALDLPLLTAVSVDTKAVLFTLGVAIVSGVLFGVLPAFQVRSIHVGPELKEGARGSTRGGRLWLRSALVVSEIALACLLLVGTGLLTKSFLRVIDVNLGFQPAHVLALRVDPSFALGSLDRQDAFLDDVLARTRALPGIEGAGITDALPFGGDREWGVRGVGQVYPAGHVPQAFIRVVTDGYLEAMGIAVRDGRIFDPKDRATTDKVAVVNETLARAVWPGQDAIGKRLNLPWINNPTVVGVVADVRHEALEQESGGELYLSMRQVTDYSNMQLVMRTSLTEEALAPAIRAALRPVDPNLPVHTFQPLEDLVNRAVSPRRFVVMLLAGFAGFALLLASLGIYAVISQSVTQRTQEIGIRMALGASAADVQRRVLLGTLSLAGLGLVIGLVLSRLLTTTLASLLFGVTPGDPTTFIAMALTLTTVAALAGYVPAWRASRIDPMKTLRSS